MPIRQSIEVLEVFSEHSFFIIRIKYTGVNN